MQPQALSQFCDMLSSVRVKREPGPVALTDPRHRPSFEGEEHTMNIVIESRTPHASETELSVTRASAVLEVSPPVFRKGLNGGTIPGRGMGTIAELASRPILTKLETETGSPVPVLRPGLARNYPGENRPFAGWKIDQSAEDTTLALDRWWKPSGRDLILGAGGFIVAVGSVVCAVLGDIDEKNLREQYERICYSASLAGVLRGDGSIEIFGEGTWATLAKDVIGMRVLGGGGGNFMRV